MVFFAGTNIIKNCSNIFFTWLSYVALTGLALGGVFSFVGARPYAVLCRPFGACVGWALICNCHVINHSFFGMVFLREQILSKIVQIFFTSNCRGGLLTCNCRVINH